MQNEIIDKLKNAGYITVTDDSQGIADKVGVSGGGTGEESGYYLFGDDASAVVNAIVNKVKTDLIPTIGAGQPDNISVSGVYTDDDTAVYLIDEWERGQDPTVVIDALNGKLFVCLAGDHKLSCTFNWNDGDYHMDNFEFDISDYSSTYEALYIDMESPTGTLDITKNGTYNVFNYASAKVAVPGPSGSVNIDKNGTYNVSSFASANVNVSGGSPSDDYALKTAYYKTKPDDTYDGLLPDTPSAHRYDSGNLWIDSKSHIELTSDEISFIKTTLGDDFNIDDDYTTFEEKMISALGGFQQYMQWSRELLSNHNLFPFSGTQIVFHIPTQSFTITLEDANERLSPAGEVSDLIDDFEGIDFNDWRRGDLISVLQKYNCEGYFQTVSAWGNEDHNDATDRHIILLRNITNEFDTSWPWLVTPSSTTGKSNVCDLTSTESILDFGEEGSIHGYNLMNIPQDSMWTADANVTVSNMFIKDANSTDPAADGYTSIQYSQFPAALIGGAEGIVDDYCVQASQFDMQNPCIYLLTVVYVSPKRAGVSGNDRMEFIDKFGYYLALVKFTSNMGPGGGDIAG